MAATETRFRFESYGVRVLVEGSDRSMVEDAERVARASLLGNVRIIRGGPFDHYFELTHLPGGTYRIARNGQRIASGRSRLKFFHFFDAMIRVSVGEAAKEFAFMHAGAVAWNGNAIILPADSFQGKTTLVAELVKRGAVYYSDEFAVIDEAGNVHPFARPLSIRCDDAGSVRQSDVPVEDLGGISGTGPLPVRFVLLTGYSPNARSRPKRLTAGAGVMAMMPFTLSMPTRPEFSMRILNNLARRAIIYSSLRGNAKTFAKTLLDFVDKRVN
jgi:hypothetical protein